MNYKYHLALDIGASSGKAIVGYLDENNKLQSEVIYRFKNGYEIKDGHKVWNLTTLFNEVKNTLKEAFKKYTLIETMSIDTWGCDYVLLDKDDQEILPCYSYRDERTNDILDEVFSKISKKEIFDITGSQYQPFNTIYQLYKDKKDGRLNKTESYLMIPEYLMFKLTDKKANEITNASTTSLLEKNILNFSKILVDKLDLPAKIFKKPAKVGYFLGNLLPEIAREVGGNLKVKFCATHDTASVVRYIEKDLDENTLYLSSGTWSLLGTKLNYYAINELVYKNNFSNELGKDYVRFQKNIMGLWLIQNLIKEIGISIEEAISMAKMSSVKDILINVNDERFLSTDNMKNAILSYLKEQKHFEDFKDEDLINIVFVSLAYSYRDSIKEIESILNKKFDKLLILGGGAKNQYLNNLVSEICKIEVKVFPMECSALGNLLSQIED